MQLFTREWGTGDRHAVLIHGVMSDSRNWRTVGPALADLGYHVVAVDLPGHGNSPKAAEYTPELLAASVIESVPAHPHLAMGHSLGGYVLSLALPELQPTRAIYVDPAFSSPRLPWWLRLLAPMSVRRLLASSREKIARNNPRWDPEDVEVEAETFRAFDQRMIGMMLEPDAFRAPTSMLVPSLMVLADNSQLVNDELAERMRLAGFEVRVVRGATHTVNRDDFAAFMAALDGWL
ncbi:alpha/beta hydrolase [Microbacterium sp. STN6]|uniref:alpha/beta fold hydrolase n=1 Tax=Microbacterium sp. STN6 TaxID=2995588 RepID=UPI002260F685|nr:alpha/beta hydrolase [Microbacterium sp. STN6]MCX7521827.1 alpha/beta hydrolase [Microbacterium sp. STN6]